MIKPSGERVGALWGRAERRERARTPSRYRPLVLLVEDDPHDLEIYGKTLWYNGFDLVQGSSGEEAVKLAREHAPDLILVDLVMPGMNGIEACRRIRSDPTLEGVPILALTARPRREFGPLARHAGFDGYLEKPIGPLSVLRAVEELVGRAPPAGEDDPPTASA
jgi:CheY-like chemotaxis protein